MYKKCLKIIQFYCRQKATEKSCLQADKNFAGSKTGRPCIIIVLSIMLKNMFVFHANCYKRPFFFQSPVTNGRARVEASMGDNQTLDTSYLCAFRINKRNKIQKKEQPIFSSIVIRIKTKTEKKVCNSENQFFFLLFFFFSSFWDIRMAEICANVAKRQIGFGMFQSPACRLSVFA